MLKAQGTWSLVFEVEIKGTNSMNEDIGGTQTVTIPLTDVSMDASAEKSAIELWRLLTREMLEGYLDDCIENDDEVFIRNPKLVLEGEVDHLEREL